MTLRLPGDIRQRIAALERWYRRHWWQQPPEIPPGYLNRSAVARVALLRGLAVLEAEADGPGNEE